jgi:hypothetical protein
LIVGTDYKRRLHQQGRWDPERFRAEAEQSELDALFRAWGFARQSIRSEFLAQIGFRGPTESFLSGSDELAGLKDQQTSDVTLAETQAILARRCPKCGKRGRIARSGKGVAYLECKDCGVGWKRERSSL